jgi:hypothetical protein
LLWLTVTRLTNPTIKSNKLSWPWRLPPKWNISILNLGKQRFESSRRCVVVAAIFLFVFLSVP